ncbi:hypothetical protein PDIDSM_5277 [Penicillium digitatum]|nr:hypothetical protein PDIDSM_5277 [Penicillium digitatum]
MVTLGADDAQTGSSPGIAASLWYDLGNAVIPIPEIYLVLTPVTEGALIYSYSICVARTGDDEGSFVSVLVRPASFVFCPEPWNDWQAELNRNALIADEPSDWPTLVIHELIDSPEPGTEANPIVIGDNPAPLGSASNPIVIHVDEDCGYDEAEQPGSDADTEIIAPPEFWEKLIDESFPVPADERTDVNPVFIPSPTTQLAFEDPEEPRILEQNCPRLDDKATKNRSPKAMEDHSVALCGQGSQAEIDQNKNDDNTQVVSDVPDACSITDQSYTLEPPYGPCGRLPAKCRLSDTDGVYHKTETI